MANLIHQRQPTCRERFLAPKGQEWLPVKVADLRQIYSSDEPIFGLTIIGQRVLLDEALDRIEAELDP